MEDKDTFMIGAETSPEDSADLKAAVADSGKEEAANTYDVGNLAVFDSAPINAVELKKNSDAYLRELTRDNLQLLVNKLFRLESKDIESGRLAMLPPPTFVLPRAKPVPKERPLTRWQKFAQERGIKKHKKESMVWDEVKKEWRPRFGFKRGNDETDDWMIEAKSGQDDGEGAVDPFTRISKEKKDRVNKQKGREMRNIREAYKAPAPTMVQTGDTLTKKKQFTPKERLNATFDIARDSTASMGKFDKKVEDEPKRKGVRHQRDAVVTDAGTEKAKSLSLAMKVLAGGDKKVLDNKKAANWADRKGQEDRKKKRDRDADDSSSKKKKQKK
eukprot:TRINITY_DN4600_c0_g1::TRINITY_DN4600_c0_g1_i1::g.23225::m.23225 TRINITY_DN4600_c0_g1::TRINITY_DN4600_c0_g1_i1::g.23225  ORF type:complete len:340 (+),score=107.83,sp/Q869Q2/RRS1_DICDI/46.43/1e-52,RRS1/PF04939.7/9.6e-53,RRS1/PF04939.7/4e+03,GRA6/PF05084.8/0.08,Chloroa_b-bind/PF00504.16/5,Chloroa_b-bind/PF00504.16/2.9 TRINITY_DN4600_c0_g1_i1:33-1022(+)